jgi:hypothetical protein
MDDTTQPTKGETKTKLAPTSLKDVVGRLAVKGSPRTLEEMEAAIEAEVRERHRRGRY